MFRGRNRQLKFDPQNGDSVEARGKLGLYSARGDFQLIVDHMQAAGEGKLKVQFEAIKSRLDAEGWFDASEKKSLPALPATIGIITSPTGAAVRDVLQVLRRRYPQAGVIIYPTMTQGASAAPLICKAVHKANARKEVDVLLLVRGGGSMEDLWAFNEIAVAQSIRDSQIPIVAGIGHEVDITISDLVSDLRAPTPSAAAELATPDTSSLHQRVRDASRRLSQVQRTRLEHCSAILRQRIERLYLRHPERVLTEQAQRVDDLIQRLSGAPLRQIERHKWRLAKINSELALHSPDRQLSSYRSYLQSIEQRLSVGMRARTQSAQTKFALLTRALHSVSPLAVLDRGYAVLSQDEQLIVDPKQVEPGDQIHARLAKGEIVARVEAKKHHNRSGK